MQRLRRTLLWPQLNTRYKTQLMTRVKARLKAHRRYAAAAFMLPLFIIMLASCANVGENGGRNIPDNHATGEIANVPDGSQDEQDTIVAPVDREAEDADGDSQEESFSDDESALTEEEKMDRLRAQFDITSPDSVTVLVNKTFGLPEEYEPDDLVKVDIPFIYQDETVHSMRKIAADALLELFAAAKEDGIELAGVSGYRSYAIQKMLYERYVARDGEEAANKYSAKPGHSEHSTGLAMDVSDRSGRCPARDCFADTEEAAWLADHAHKFGFIIRYPLGKEHITGYQYEPWHLRYVGVELATILREHDWTMEEFFLGPQPQEPAG